MIDGSEAAKLGVVNHSVEQNEAGDAGYFRALELAQEIIPNVGVNKGDNWLEISDYNYTVHNDFFILMLYLGMVLIIL